MNKPTVYYAMLSERTGAANDACYNAALDVAEHCGANGYKHLRLGYSRTDYTRNEFVKAFLKDSTRDNDIIVMLDCDHRYPADIVSRLSSKDPIYGVVGALAYRRGEPYDPLFFVRLEGGLHALAEFDHTVLFPCAIVSTSAIAIRRWVFIELQQKGYFAPFFRYEYPTGEAEPSEDMYFGRICEQSGIWHYCDTTTVIPHASQAWVDQEVHDAYMANHKEIKIATQSIEIPNA
jgi:hypothetical protein